MPRPPHILFIMADQLRWDCLGCSGHPHMRTPNIDRLAAKGVRFDRAFVQAPVCGPSRMSFYTGRYSVTHGATYNNFPLRADEKTMGDYLRPLAELEPDAAMEAATALAGRRVPVVSGFVGR